MLGELLLFLPDALFINLSLEVVIGWGRDRLDLLLLLFLLFFGRLGLVQAAFVACGVHGDLEFQATGLTTIY